MQPELRKLFDFAAESAKHIFEKSGSIVPMWVAVNKKGSHAPLLVPDLSDKDRAANAVKAFLKKHEATKYVSILECWTYEGKEMPQEIRKGKSLEHNPDSREAIQILAEDNEGNIISGMFYILRPEHGKPKLSPIKMMPAAEQHTGRFAGMLS